MENKEKGKGWLMSAFKGATFRKAVVSVALGLTVLGGMAQTAEAQTQTRGGVTVTQTDQYQQQKPWANDPEYIRKHDALVEQTRLYLQSYQAKADAYEAKLNAQHAAALNKQVQQGRRTAQGGWTGMEILTTASNAGAIEKQFQATLKVHHNNVRSTYLNANLKLEANLDKLDDAYARQYLRADQLAQRDAQRQQAISQQAQVKKDANAPMSPDELHDALVKQYQAQVLANAKAGKPLPDPAQYGLDKNDPAVKIGGPQQQR